MDEVGKALAKKLVIFLAGSLLVRGGLKAIENKQNGKTLFGREKVDQKNKTYVDWQGNVRLGPSDGWVV